MSTVLSRWGARLTIRRGLLAYAERQAAYWRAKKRKAAHGTKAYSHAGAMLADREKKVAKRRGQVAYAERVVARNRRGVSPELTMFDAVTVSNIPPDAKAVAGYVGGRWPTYLELLRRFPQAYHLSIAVTAAQDAECLDVEPGDARPDQAPAWVKRQMERGVKQPVVYASVSTMPQVLAELRKDGISRSQVRLWTAHYTQHVHRCTPKCGFGFNATADATQYTSNALGRSLDASLVRKGFFS